MYPVNICPNTWGNLNTGTTCGKALSGCLSVYLVVSKNIKAKTPKKPGSGQGVGQLAIAFPRLL